MQVVVVAGEVIRRYAPGGGMEEEREPQERHPHGASFAPPGAAGGPPAPAPQLGPACCLSAGA